MVDAHRYVKGVTLYALAVFGVILLFAPTPAHAMLPPNVIFALGSQVAQIWALAGVAVLGALASVAPFAYRFFGGWFQTRFVKVGLGVIAGVCALVLWSYVTVVFLAPLVAPWGMTATSTPVAVIGDTQAPRFYSDRFVFMGTRASGAPVVFEISANRKEQSRDFIHYYFLSIVDGSVHSTDYQERTATTSSVLSSLLFDEFERTTPPDHSAREGYHLSFSHQGTHYALESEELQGDFITKNEPEYTQYESVTDATLRAGSEVISGHLYFQRTYSNDYRTSVFFDGFDELRSVAFEVIVWDEAGNFYLVDKSQVASYNPAYTSHFWALSKNNNGDLRKAFDGSVTVSTDNSALIKVPALGIQSLQFSLVAPFGDGQTEGYGEGVITTADGARPVRGLYMSKRYGDY